MKRAVILQHVPHEGLARLAPLLSQLGYELELRRASTAARRSLLSRATSS